MIHVVLLYWTSLWRYDSTSLESECELVQNEFVVIFAACLSDVSLYMTKARDVVEKSVSTNEKVPVLLRVFIKETRLFIGPQQEYSFLLK